MSGVATSPRKKLSPMTSTSGKELADKGNIYVQIIFILYPLSPILLPNFILNM